MDEFLNNFVKRFGEVGKDANKKEVEILDDYLTAVDGGDEDALLVLNIAKCMHKRAHNAGIHDTIDLLKASPFYVNAMLRQGVEFYKHWNFVNEVIADNG